jgi:signal transduction histidine kinase
MNLLLNAVQAINNQGTICLRTGILAGKVWFEIDDNGKGIPVDNIGRIFDPFFTTQPIGKGPGLGLSLAYGIIKNHHGRIEVESTIGKGSRFRVWLPMRQVKNTDNTE